MFKGFYLGTEEVKGAGFVLGNKKTCTLAIIDDHLLTLHLHQCLHCNKFKGFESILRPIANSLKIN